MVTVLTLVTALRAVAYVCATLQVLVLIILGYLVGSKYQALAHKTALLLPAIEHTCTWPNKDLVTRKYEVIYDITILLRLL